MFFFVFFYYAWQICFLKGSVANKFYVHNDIFRYEDEVFGDSEAELDEGKMLTNIPSRTYLLVFSSCSWLNGGMLVH